MEEEDEMLLKRREERWVGRKACGGAHHTHTVD